MAAIGVFLATLISIAITDFDTHQFAFIVTGTLALPAYFIGAAVFHLSPVGAIVGFFNTLLESIARTFFLSLGADIGAFDLALATGTDLVCSAIGDLSPVQAAVCIFFATLESIAITGFHPFWTTLVIAAAFALGTYFIFFAGNYLAPIGTSTGFTLTHHKPIARAFSGI